MIGLEADGIERRIERFLLGWGAVAIAGAAGWGGRAAAGAACGAALCWLNFRWLRSGTMAVMRAGLAQAGAEKVHVPRSLRAGFFGRYALLILAVYVILTRFRWPAVAVLCGLSALIPAILMELGYELLRGGRRAARGATEP